MSNTELEQASPEPGTKPSPEMGDSRAQNVSNHRAGRSGLASRLAAAGLVLAGYLTGGASVSRADTLPGDPETNGDPDIAVALDNTLPTAPNVEAAGPQTAEANPSEAIGPLRPDNIPLIYADPRNGVVDRVLTPAEQHYLAINRVYIGDTFDPNQYPADRVDIAKDGTKIYSYTTPQKKVDKNPDGTTTVSQLENQVWTTADNKVALVFIYLGRQDRDKTTFPQLDQLRREVKFIDKLTPGGSYSGHQTFGTQAFGAVYQQGMILITNGSGYGPDSTVFASIYVDSLARFRNSPFANDFLRQNTPSGR